MKYIFKMRAKYFETSVFAINFWQVFPSGLTQHQLSTEAYLFPCLSVQKKKTAHLMRLIFHCNISGESTAAFLFCK